MVNSSKFEFTVFEKNRNPLLEREEVQFEVTHQGAPTPNRLEMKEKIAGRLKVVPELVYIIKMETKTNTWKTVGLAHVYPSHEKAKLLAPKHIGARELPGEEKAKLTEKKKVRKAPRAKAPSAPKPPPAKK